MEIEANTGNDGDVQFKPMRMSENIAELAQALSRAQGQMSHPAKNKTAKVTSAKGSYSYNYADLADCLDVIRKPLSDNGIAVVQIPCGGDGGVSITTRLIHQSGQWIEGTLFMPCADARPQSIGSAITYARRYSLSPMTGIASDDDDDGNLAQSNQAETTQRVRNSSQPKGASTARTNPVSESVKKMLEAFKAVKVGPEVLMAHVGIDDPSKFDENHMEYLKDLYTDVKHGRIKPEQILPIEGKRETKAVDSKPAQDRSGDALRQAFGTPK